MNFNKMSLNTKLMTIFFVSIIDHSSPNCLPSSCAEVLLQGNTKSGVYTIHPRSWYSVYPFKVYCDMETDGGGWTMFQRREDYLPRENFFRNWNDYKQGFGDLNKEFWLGNDYIYVLTNQDHVTLRIDLEDFEGNTRRAEYRQFQVQDERNSYRLTISGYHGNASDGMTNVEGHNANNALFTTFDKNDIHDCAGRFKGGWWYVHCHDANLNGLYLKGNHSSAADGVNWRFWLGYYYSLKRSEMKVRPTNFSPHSHILLE